LDEKNISNEEEPKKISDKVLVFIALGIIIVIAGIFSVRFFLKDKVPKTIDDLHQLNLEGKLDEEQGYVYAGYSFVKYDDMWHTRMLSPMRTREYNIHFRYGPKEAEDVPLSGQLNLTLFNDAKDYYVTFNPIGEGLQYVALAVNDFNQQMINIFFKTPIPACDRNETDACASVPTINCTNTDKLVFYVITADETRVQVDNNCIIVEGNEFELVRAVDKLLYTFYGIL
jgi:hypothetical protein